MTAPCSANSALASNPANASRRTGVAANSGYKVAIAGGFRLLIALPIASVLLAGQAEAQTPRTWELREEFRIGGAAETRIDFSSLGAGALSADGRLFVLDHGQQRFHAFHRSGRLLFTSGRSGEGPGEFRRSLGLGLRGERLFVVDMGLQRLNWFTLSGDFIDSAPIPPASYYAPLDAGLAVGVDPLVAGRQEPARVFRHDGPGPAIPLAEVGSPGEAFFALPMPNGRQLAIVSPVQLSDIVRVPQSGDYFVVVNRRPASGATGASIRVMKISVTGDTLLHAHVPYRPVRIDASERRRIVDDFVERMFDVPAGERTPFATRRQAADAIGGALSLPDFHPPVTAALLGSDGSIWLRREGLGRPDVEWIVLATDGKPQARLVLPAALSIIAAGPDEVWAWQPDELDVPVLLRFRLVRRN